MGKKTLVAAFMLLFISPLAISEAADQRKAGIAASDKQEKLDRKKEYACDCCQKCKAATRPIKPKVEEGPAKTDGCKDCCRRCGRVVLPAPDEMPPEIIEKEIPPEIKDKRTAPDVIDRPEK